MTMMNSAEQPCHPDGPDYGVDPMVFKDSLMVLFSKAGLSYRWIGTVLNINASTVCRRLEKMPPEKRSALERSTFVDLLRGRR